LRNTALDDNIFGLLEQNQVKIKKEQNLRRQNKMFIYNTTDPSVNNGLIMLSLQTFSNCVLQQEK
jgi:hypothetical protein